MIDDGDLTIDGADLLAEIRSANQADASVSDDDATATETPLDSGTPINSRTGTASAASATSRGGRRTTRWQPPAAVVPAAVDEPSVGGMSRVQVGIVGGVVALGLTIGAAIGLARAGGDTGDDDSTISQSTGSPMAEGELGE